MKGTYELLPILFPPGLEDIMKPRIEQWLPIAMSEPLLLHSMLYAAKVNRRPFNLDQKLGHDILYHETEALKLLRGAIMDCTVVDDSVILSTICMSLTSTAPTAGMAGVVGFRPPLQSLQLLDALGTSHCRDVHMQGLIDLVKAKGGIQAIKLERLAEIVSL
jgi:hypothetical protein